MKNCVYQKLTVNFLVLLNILNLMFGISISSRLLAQPIPETSALPLPFRACWSYQIKLSDHAIASDNHNTIIIPTFEGGLIGIDLKSGKKLWQAELGGRVISDVIVGSEEDSIFVATESSSITDQSNTESPINFNAHKELHTTIKIRSLNKTSGITNWQTSLPPAAIQTRKMFVGIYDHKIIVADQSGSITVLGKTAGEILSKQVYIFGSVNSVNSANPVDGVYYDLYHKHLIILAGSRVILADVETGNHTLLKKTDSILTAAYLSDDVLILGNKKGEITAIDRRTKKNLWKFRSGAEISNFSLTPNGLAATSLDNFIYLIEPKSGKVIWKKRLEGRIVIKPLVLGNYLIVTTLGSSKATIIYSENGSSVNQIYLDDDNYFAGSPVFIDNYVVFQTAEGLFTFTPSNNQCAAK